MVDLSLDTRDVTKTSDLDNVIQQIEILFDTSPFDVIGETTFGSDFERFLWDLNASNYDIEQYINARIRSGVDLLGYSVNTKATLMKGTENDIILVDIIISRDGREYTKTYKIDQI